MSAQETFDRFNKLFRPEIPPDANTRKAMGEWMKRFNIQLSATLSQEKDGFSDPTGLITTYRLTENPSSLISPLFYEVHDGIGWHNETGDAEWAIQVLEGLEGIAKGHQEQETPKSTTMEALQQKYSYTSLETDYTAKGSITVAESHDGGILFTIGMDGDPCVDNHWEVPAAKLNEADIKNAHEQAASMLLVKLREFADNWKPPFDLTSYLKTLGYGVIAKLPEAGVDAVNPQCKENGR